MTPAHKLLAHKPRAVIVDIDGTVALHRLPDGRLTRPHHQYNAVSWDLPNQSVIDTVLALRASGYQIIFCSGRPIMDQHGFNVGEATYTWLAKHLGSWALQAPLLMRAAGDRRADDIVKREIYDAWIRDRYDARLALDDRDRVVALWRSLGITCLQVADGDF